MLAEHLHPGSVPPDKPGLESWDRRRRNRGAEDAIQALEGAVRHLVFDQMGADRVYSEGARDAVVILWAAIKAIHTEAHAQQSVARLAAAWLPHHALARWQRDQSLADELL